MGDYESMLYDAQLDAYLSSLHESENVLTKEDLNKIADGLHEKMDELRDALRTQNLTLKEVFRTVKEINEEYRIDHPKFDKLVKMADEWGLED